MAVSASTLEIPSFVAAADLLRRMFLELERLGLENSRLHFAMLHRTYAIRQRLDKLSGVVELLKSAVAPLQVSDLSRRAKGLIAQLSDELEEISHEAEDEFEWIEVPHV